MFESVGCGERQLPAHHSDLVQNRLVNGATFQLESILNSYNFLVCDAPGIPFKLLFAKNPFKKAYQSSHAGLKLGCRLHVAGRAGKLVRMHAVGGLAMGADDVQGFAYKG